MVSTSNNDDIINRFLDHFRSLVCLYRVAILCICVHLKNAQMSWLCPISRRRLFGQQTRLSSFFQNLSEEQILAVTAPLHGVSVCNAGPGSGKVAFLKFYILFHDLYALDKSYSIQNCILNAKSCSTFFNCCLDLFQQSKK